MRTAWEIVKWIGKLFFWVVVGGFLLIWGFLHLFSKSMEYVDFS